MIMTEQADIAVIGLAVMGQNLILNIAEHGFTVVAFNRTTSKMHEFVNGPGKHPHILPAESLADLIKLLKRPRKIVLMVKAGQAIDDFISQLEPPLLQPGDILVDGGNSHYLDTARRCKELEIKGIHFMGCGISGGEEGARFGPSIMPGGSHEAFGKLAPILTSIAARAPQLNVPCCAWVGEAGAGHFVKMVHNGIEYGDMQLIAESYHLLKSLVSLSGPQLPKVFSDWNGGELNSFLIEITANILKVETDGEYLVEKIRDVAGQKGTGKWTVNASLDLGIPTTLITEAVFARGLSALKEERLEAAKLFPSPSVTTPTDKESSIIEDIKSALYASKIISYTQGFMMMREAAREYNYSLNFPSIATLWMGGCIIRSVFLSNIHQAFTRKPDLQSLLFDPFFSSALQKCLPGWRRIVALAVQAGVPVPAMSAALAFFDGYRTGRLPANLIQAQRDYFGAHTFEYEEKPGTFVHYDWIHSGAHATSGSYNA